MFRDVTDLESARSDLSFPSKLNRAIVERTASCVAATVPARWFVDGENEVVVEVELEGVGVLRNPVVAGEF